DKDGNLTNEFLRYGRSIVISYIDKDGDEKELLLTLEDFEYDKTLNYENGSNGKCKISYEENETERGESENIKRTRFDESGDECSNTRDVNGFGGRNMPLIYNGIGDGSSGNSGGNSTGGSSGNTGNPNNPGLNIGSGGNPTSGNTTGPNTGTGNTKGLGNSTGSNTGNPGSNTGGNPGGSNQTGETGTGNPSGNSVSSITPNQKLALDEIFKNLQMNRTNNDDNDLEELRKVSKRLADLLNMENVNKN
ncbi:17955_t:CDS:2, partial [Dentiscutata erythropus]